jgi:predicted RNA methylase
VDDSEFAGICKKLAHVNSPYDFNSIPIHILGSIYERFLGKVIVTTAKRATLEEKPEVRKAGGVYYTPEYIVRYIVENTVGKQIEGKTPAQIAEMRFADIACGSGSFLLGVFDLLLSYHGKWFNANPDKAKKAGCVLGDDGAWHLALKQRREILINNIYGVDIDNQAVEVAQLSLYLKLLEEETTASARQHQLEFHETILPSLNKNIVCGNSLIGTDIETGQLFASDEERKLNPMDYEQRFPEIMKRGGFDTIVGNPPWGVDFSETEQDYLRKGYKTAEASNVDSYTVFVEAATRVLRRGGLLGYIVPDTFLRKDDYLPTRNFILKETRVRELIETGPVFSQVRDTWCLVFTVEKNKPSSSTVVCHKKLSRFIVSAEERLKKFGLGSWDSISEVPQSLWLARPSLIVGYLAEASAQVLIEKIETNPRLAMLTNRFLISRGEEGSKFNLTGKLDGDFSMVTPENVERYEVADGLKVGGETLARGKVESYYKHPKIWIIRIQKMRWKQRIVCGLDDRKNSSAMKTLQVVVSTNDDKKELKYLQALLASKLVNFWCINYLADDMNQSYLGKIPVRQIDFSKPADKAKHDKIVSLVEQMLAAKKQLAAAQSDKDKDFYGHKCDSLDRQIDQLVYELYGLTDEEVQIVEGNA